MPRKVFDTLRGEERRRAAVVGRAEMPVPARVQQHRLAAHVAVEEHAGRYAARGRVGQVEHLGGQVHQRREIEMLDEQPRHLAFGDGELRHVEAEPLRAQATAVHERDADVEHGAVLTHRRSLTRTVPSSPRKAASDRVVSTVPGAHGGSATAASEMAALAFGPEVHVKPTLCASH